MDDLISRQAAILAIEEYADRLQMVNWKENPGVPYKAYALNWAINTLRDLPSAEPERKKGKWIIFDTLYGDEAHCWECHRSLYVNEPGNGLPDVKELHFCPFCGADMRGEQDG